MVGTKLRHRLEAGNLAPFSIGPHQSQAGSKYAAVAEEMSAVVAEEK